MLTNATTNAYTVHSAECIVYMNKKEKSSLLLTTLFCTITVNSA